MSLFVQFLLGVLFTFLIGYKLGQYNKAKDDEDVQLEHSRIESAYQCGKKPHWNVGDTLAYRVFYSDREGECVWGKVTKIEFDDEEKERCDWFYTFEDGIGVYEQLLLEEQTYKKN